PYSCFCYSSIHCHLAAISTFNFVFFVFNDTATTEIYTTTDTLSLHDALPICDRPCGGQPAVRNRHPAGRARSEEHTSELQSPVVISYAVFCLKKKKKKIIMYYIAHIHNNIQRRHTYQR